MDRLGDINVISGQHDKIPEKHLEVKTHRIIDDPPYYRKEWNKRNNKAG